MQFDQSSQIFFISILDRSWNMKNKVFSFREKKAILFCTKVSFYLALTSWRSETKQNKHNFKKRNLYFFGSYVILFAFLMIVTISCMHFTNTLQVKSICKRKILHLMLACVWNTKCPDVLDYTNVPFFSWEIFYLYKASELWFKKE